MFHNLDIRDLSKTKNPQNCKSQISLDLLNKFENIIYSKGFNGLSYVSIEEKYHHKFSPHSHHLIIFRAAIPPEILKLDPAPSKHKLIDDEFIGYINEIFGFLDFLRENGFEAELVNPIDREMDLKVCAERSGDGVIGRGDICIFPNGNNFVLFAIACSIENLPIKKINKHLWVKNNCLTCGLCITKCPVKAYDENEKILKKVCIGYREGCGQCMTNCPFFTKTYDEIKEIYNIKSKLELWK